MIALNETRMVKQTLLYMVGIIVILGLSLFIYFLYFVNTDVYIRIVGTIIVILIAVICLLFEYKRQRARSVKYESSIKRFVLITRDGDKEKEWHCEGMTSLLIGKGTAKREVDIELGDTHYSEYISNEHAVMNYYGGYWYIEDLNSRNGVGIKKKGEEYALRLKPLVSYKIDEGDIIYISKAKILVR